MIDAKRHNCKMSALTVCSRHLKRTEYYHELSSVECQTLDYVPYWRFIQLFYTKLGAVSGYLDTKVRIPILARN